MTPRMLDALLKRKERERQDGEFLFAQLTSMIVNYSMSPPKKAAAPADFMPSEWAKKAALRRRGPTKEERMLVESQARSLIAALRERKNGKQ